MKFRDPELPEWIRSRFFSIEQNFSFVRWLHARQNFHQGAFSCSVFSDQGKDLPFCKERFTPPKARTPGKDFPMPRTVNKEGLPEEGLSLSARRTKIKNRQSVLPQALLEGAPKLIHVALLDGLGLHVNKLVFRKIHALLLALFRSVRQSSPLRCLALSCSMRPTKIITLPPSGRAFFTNSAHMRPAS